MDGIVRTDSLVLTHDILRLIAEIDEFKGAWSAVGRIACERLATLPQLRPSVPRCASKGPR